VSRRLGALLAILLPLLLPSPLATAADPLVYAAGTRCACPVAVTRFQAPLTHVAARIKARQPLKIVAVGSSSTQGYGSSGPDHSYPSRLQALLGERLPGVSVSVINRGVGGEESPQMLARFDTQVLTERPDLVIWQVGSNGALRGHPPAQLATALNAGIDRLQAAGIDVVLMNTQYVPATLAVPRIGDYVLVVSDAARSHGIDLLDRYAVMHHWVSSKAMTLDEPAFVDGLHLNDLGYDCLARVLTDAILDAAGQRLEEYRQASKP